MTTFTGWPADAVALPADIAADSRPEVWAAHRERYALAVRAPLRTLAAALDDTHVGPPAPA